jgi:hypothetical protein
MDKAPEVVGLGSRIKWMTHELENYNDVLILPAKQTKDFAH